MKFSFVLYAVFLLVAQQSEAARSGVDARNTICLKVYAAMKKKPKHAAFAVSPVFKNGQACAEAYNRPTVKTAIKVALTKCQVRMKKERKGFRGKCRVTYSR